MTEAAYSGFGEYSRQLSKRLAPVYDLAVLESYGIPFSGQSHEGYRYYPNALPRSHPDYEQYDKELGNQFGMFNFERVLLDFNPDVVLDFRDPQMTRFMITSPLRRFYKLILSPTVDSSPQLLSFLDWFEQADLILTYSDFGMETLKKEIGNNARLFKPAYMGINHDIFKPLNKDQIRTKYGIPNDWLICTFVGRNQRRKLFLDLIDAFEILKDKDRELFNRTYFHFHTPLVDLNPFNLSYWLMESGLGHKILFTYTCTECNNVEIHPYRGPITYCSQCRKNSSATPTVATAISQEQLAELYNIGNAYVQYCTCEGAGVPLMEAMSCGIPSFGVDYSAVSDNLRLGKGTPIKVQRFFYELELNAKRALPDNEDFINQLIKLFKLPRQIREKIGFESHMAAKEYFNWDKNAETWIDAIESLDLSTKLSWNCPKINYQPNFDVPTNLTVKDFVNWCFDNVWMEPKLKNSYLAYNTIYNIEVGAIPENNKLRPFTAEIFFNFCKQKAQDKITCEKIRCGEIMMQENDCIRYSRINQMVNQ